ncbi:flagellar assembly protein FliX [Roseococcus sp.]|uniref:flagellar assembly protein FliX n=1 Tax=Roseococcus sp. TaxID=2109646 RepID=UPI003BAC8B5A
MLTPIRGYTAIGRGAATRRSGGAGFALPEAERGREAAAAGSVTGSLGLIGLQEGFSDAERDDAARRRGHAALEELEGLQLALLSGRIDAGRLSRLAQLAEGESGADPALRAIMRAISLRARIELARLSPMAR